MRNDLCQARVIEPTRHLNENDRVLPPPPPRKTLSASLPREENGTEESEGNESEQRVKSVGQIEAVDTRVITGAIASSWSDSRKDVQEALVWERERRRCRLENGISVAGDASKELAGRGEGSG